MIFANALAQLRASDRAAALLSEAHAATERYDFATAEARLADAYAVMATRMSLMMQAIAEAEREGDATA